jgi:hypothetical protein
MRIHGTDRLEEGMKNIKSEDYKDYKIWFNKNKNGLVEGKVSIDGVWYLQIGESKVYVMNRLKQIIDYNEKRKKSIINRNLGYEDKFRAYLFNGDFERHKEICKRINVRPIQGE